jgi:protein-tyrosine phosphatase
MAKTSILFVCMGNICRSPTAEGVLRAKAEQRGLARELRIASAGTHDYHVGDAPDPRSIRHAARRGYDLSGLRARQVRMADFHDFAQILALDRGHLGILISMAPPGAGAKLAMFLDASARWPGQDVPDPYYGGPAGFEQVLDMVEEAAEGWLDRVAAKN